MFVFNVLFARYLSASLSGWVFFQVTIFTVIIQVAGFSLESGVGYYSAKKEIPAGRLIGFSLLWSSLAAALVMVLFRPAANLLSLPVNYPLGYPSAFLFGNMLISFGNAICYSKHRYVLPNAVQIVVSGVFIILLAAGVKGIDFTALFFYTFAIQGILLFGMLILSGKEYAPSFALFYGTAKRVFGYSRYAFLANLLFLLFMRADYYFVKRFCSPADLGNYIQVSRIGQMFFLLPAMVSTVLFPLMAADDKESLTRLVRKFSLRFLALFSTLAIALAISGKWLFPWLYGESFNNMYVPFLLMAPGIVCLCSLYPYTAYYAAKNRIMVNIRGSLLGLLVVSAGDMVLVPLLGIEGASLVRSLGYIAFQFYLISIFKHG